MFEELLSNEFFTTGSLVTRWPSECIWIEELYEKKVPVETIERAEEKKIHNLVVANNKKVPIGFVPVQVAKKTIVLKEKSVKKSERLRVSEDMRVVPLIHRLTQEGTKGFPLLFVQNSAHETIGIMNYSDLNRKSIYLYSYTMLLFLEHWLKESIRKGMPDKGLSNRCIETLSTLPTRSPKYANRHDQILSVAKSRGQRPLVACDLKDLVFIMTNDQGLRMPRGELSASALDFASQILRNRVAHPNNLLISSRNADQHLASLHQLFQEMESFVRKHDFNDKVRIYS